MVAKVIFCLLCAQLSLGCHPQSQLPANSGIEFKLSSQGDAPFRPDGSFRVEGLEGNRSVHVPLSPVELSSTSQRIELPPGSYKVSYVPVEFVPSLHSLQRRQAVLSSSPNVFVVQVSPGKFSTVQVRALDAASSKAPPAERSALGPAKLREPARDAALVQVHAGTR